MDVLRDAPGELDHLIVTMSVSMGTTMTWKMDVDSRKSIMLFDNDKDLPVRCGEVQRQE